MEAITHGTKSLFTLCKPDIFFCSLFFSFVHKVYLHGNSQSYLASSLASASIVHIDILGINSMVPVS